VTDETTPICPLCDRPIPPGGGSLHHLIPRLKGGKGGPTVLLHQLCHKEIHATLTETELARSLRPSRRSAPTPPRRLHRLGHETPAGLPLEGPRRR
jgi:hypothetical protein